MAQGNSNSTVVTLAFQSVDPYAITDQPSLGPLQVEITRTTSIKGKTLFVYLSKDALTDQFGYMKGDNEFNTVLLFPELIGT